MSFRCSQASLAFVLLAVPLCASAGEWSEWRPASGCKAIQFRYRTDDAQKDAFGSMGFVQFRNSGRDVTEFQAQVSSSMLVSNDLGDDEMELRGHLGPNESTPDMRLGIIAKVNEVKILKFTNLAASPEPAKPDGPKTVEGVLAATTNGVLEEGKARQKRFEDLRTRAAQDYARMNATFQELARKDEKRKEEYAARVNRLENLSSMLQQSQANAFASASFGPRNPAMLAPTPLTELSNQLRQFNPELAEFNAYADMAKTLAQADTGLFKQIDGLQATANAVSSVVSLFGRKKDPEEERRKKLEVMKRSQANFDTIKGNYDRAKEGANPAYDSLGNSLINGDNDRFVADVKALSPEERERALGATLSSGDCLIHLAASTGNTDMIRFLKAQGASLEVRDAEGRNAVYRAVEANETEAAVVLMSLGANPSRPPLPKMADKEALDSVKLAHGAKNPMMVRALEKKLVPLNADPRSIEICAIARMGDVASLKERLAGSTPNVRDALGWTPLHHAVAANRLNPDSPSQLQEIEVLIDAGASINAMTLTGRSPLTLAVEKDMPLAFMALLRAGADPNARDRTGNSAVSLAKDLHRDAILLLMEKDKKK